MSNPGTEGLQHLTFWMSPLFNTPDLYHQIISRGTMTLLSVSDEEDIQNEQCCGAPGPGLF